MSVADRSALPHYPLNGVLTMSITLREVALKKDGHFYLFRADSEHHAELMVVLSRFAKSPELNFSWHDAAIVCRKFRQPVVNRVPGVLPSVPDRLR